MCARRVCVLVFSGFVRVCADGCVMRRVWLVLWRLVAALVTLLLVLWRGRRGVAWLFGLLWRCPVSMCQLPGWAECEYTLRVCWQQVSECNHIAARTCGCVRVVAHNICVHARVRVVCARGFVVLCTFVCSFVCVLLVVCVRVCMFTCLLVRACRQRERVCVTSFLAVPSRCY